MDHTLAHLHTFIHKMSEWEVGSSIWMDRYIHVHKNNNEVIGMYQSICVCGKREREGKRGGGDWMRLARRRVGIWNRYIETRCLLKKHHFLLTQKIYVLFSFFLYIFLSPTISIFFSYCFWIDSYNTHADFHLLACLPACLLTYLWIFRHNDDLKHTLVLKKGTNTIIWIFRFCY